MKTWACCTGFVAFFLAGMPSHAASGSTRAGAPIDLAVSSLLFSHSATLTRLRARRTYQATKFPFPIRLTPPDASWSGAQWKTGRLYPAFAERLGIADGGDPPHFGWVAVAHAGSSLTAPPLGLVTIVTANARTPSVAATVRSLRTRGHGATYGPTSRVTIAGFRGTQFDGEIVGPKRDHIGHIFIPFTPSTHGAHYYPDEYPVYGDVFRISVLNVHGKSVVVFAENAALPADQFPAFLTKTNQILASLRFPS